jgi:hypothetical protein
LFADFLTDGLIATVVDIDWVAHDGILVPLIPPKGLQGPLLESSPFTWGESETFWLSATSALIFDGGRRPPTPNSQGDVFVPGNS